MTRADALAAALGELRAALGTAAVLDDPERLQPYGRDESGLGAYPPDLLALPGTTGEVQRVLAVAVRYGLPVVPVGARSGKSGGILAVSGGIALCLERMNRIDRRSARTT